MLPMKKLNKQIRMCQTQLLISDTDNLSVCIDYFILSILIMYVCQWGGRVPWRGWRMTCTTPRCVLVMKGTKTYARVGLALWLKLRVVGGVAECGRCPSQNALPPSQTTLFFPVIAILPFVLHSSFQSSYSYNNLIS